MGVKHGQCNAEHAPILFRTSMVRKVGVSRRRMFPRADPKEEFTHNEPVRYIYRAGVRSGQKDRLCTIYATKDALQPWLPSDVINQILVMWSYPRTRLSM